MLRPWFWIQGNDFSNFQWVFTKKLFLRLVETLYYFKNLLQNHKSSIPPKKEKSLTLNREVQMGSTIIIEIDDAGFYRESSYIKEIMTATERNFLTSYLEYCQMNFSMCHMKAYQFIITKYIDVYKCYAYKQLQKVKTQA